jgi:hypothetical protein
MTALDPRPAEDAPRAQRESLAREARELEARIAEMNVLDVEKRALEAELDDARRAATDERRRALPLLGDVGRAGACDQAWEALVGAGRVRDCARCGARVADPRRLDGTRAREALDVSGGRLFVRPDGTVMARPCPRAARRRSIGYAAGLFLSSLLALVVLRTIDAYTPPPPAVLQYLSPATRLGHYPTGVPWQVPIAPRTR